ncbi:MAG: AsmA-like C-terminal domain-containing protein [Pseudomonadota bacterium]|nr:AsmA-like C-terminal domain-containing protein [Pseudomonadota bacterium]
MFRRITRVCWDITAIIVLGIIVLIGITTWRLSQGPVPLNFLSSHIESALNGYESPVRVKITGTNLTWAGWDRNLDIRLIDTKVTGENGQVIAKAPEVSISFSLRALLSGVLAPTKLELIRPSLSLARKDVNNVVISFGEKTNLSSETIGVIAALNAMKQNNGILQYLHQISILEAKLKVDDNVTGTKWNFPKVDFVFLRENKEIKATLFSELGVLGNASRLMAKLNFRANAKELDAKLELENFPFHKLGDLFPKFEFLKDAHLLFTGGMETRISLTGKILNSQFRFSGSNGVIKPNEFWPMGLRVSNFDLSGKFDSSPNSLELEKLNINLGGTKVRVGGTIIPVDEGVSVSGRASINSVELKRLKDYWPVGLGSSVRKWVITNMISGRVEKIESSYSIRMPNLKKFDTIVDSFSGKFVIPSSTIRFHEEFPAIKNVEATAVFSKDRFLAEISSGSLKELNIVSGKVKLLGLDTDNENITIVTTISGPLKTALMITDNKPLKFLKKYGLEAGLVKGWSRTNLTFSFPLLNNFKAKRIKFSASSRIVNAKMPRNPLKRPVESGNFDLHVDPNGLSLTGKASVNGSVLGLTWKENFETNKSNVRQILIKGKIDERLQGQFLEGLKLSPYINGPIDLDFSLSEKRSGVKEIAAKVVLKETTLNIPTLNWYKKTGDPGVGWVSAIIKNSGALEIKNLDVRAKDFYGKTSFWLDKDRNLLSAIIHKLKRGRSDVSGFIKRGDEFGYNVFLKGSSLDLVPLLSRLKEVKEEENLPNFNLKTEVDTIWLDRKVPVYGVTGNLRYGSGLVEKADLRGVLSKDHPFSLVIDTVSENQNLILRARNAGRIFNILELTDTFQGGNLNLKASRTKLKTSPWKGRLTVDDYTVVNAPVLARMLTLASLTGILNRLTGKGIKFRKLDIPFIYFKGRTKIQNARAIGDALGLTADGYLNFFKKTADLKGTIVPDNPINNVLRKVPIVGQILTGKRSSGVFATNYKYSGKFNNPEILVDPLSTFAPGVLRNLFEFGTNEPRSSTSNPK